MGFYSRVIFPRLCEWAMSDPKMAALRPEALAQVGGNVLEIGFGTGLNLEHYSKQVRRIVAVDPGEGMNRLARKRIRAKPHRGRSANPDRAEGLRLSGRPSTGW